MAWTKKVFAPGAHRRFFQKAAAFSSNPALEQYPIILNRRFNLIG
jgi:hypothetical protein